MECFQIGGKHLNETSILNKEESEMKKNEIVKEISKRLGLPKIECEAVIETFGDVVKDALVKGEKVSIRGFVSFEVTEFKGRDGYNPMTGKKEYYEPVKKVKCKIGKPIKEAINTR